jgi:hypothetical protein
MRALPLLIPVVCFVGLGVLGAGCGENGPPGTRKLDESDVKPAGTGESNEKPEVGTLVLKPATLDATRLALTTFTAKDPVKVVIGSWGRGDNPKEVELHLTLENTTKDCTVVGVRGVAYGFDARGKAATVNSGNQHFLGFDYRRLHIAPGAKEDLAIGVTNIPRASIALGHVDSVTCEGGAVLKSTR